MPRSLAYPRARREHVVDDYHGTGVADPYRWLEDADSAETLAWVEAQNRVTFDFLAQLPHRAGIHERLTRLWDYEKYGIPFREGGRYFYSRNDGLQNQAVLYVAASLAAEPRVLLDPNALSSDGSVALSSYAVSRDGRHLAYGLSRAGSDWEEWRIRDVETGEDLADELRWIKFSAPSWTTDGAGFFYSRYDEPGPGAKHDDASFYEKLYYHRLGMPQADDVLVYARDDEKEWSFHGGVTEDGRYLIITVSKGTDDKHQVFYQELVGGKGPTGSARPDPIVELLTGFAHEYAFVGNDGPVFWFKTDEDAPRGKIIAVDTRTPEPTRCKTLVPEAAETMRDASVVGDRFLVSYLRDAQTVVRIFDLAGQSVGEVELPGIGTAVGFGGRRDDSETFYVFQGYTTPKTVYRYDLETFTSTVYRQPKVDFDPAAYETRLLFYRSKDGTRVPLFVSHKKGLVLDGMNPTYLYGYGGFNVSMTPVFDVGALVWMELGGVFAVACIRGGGEYGEAWHDEGTRLSKQNVFDDFIAAAEWLIANRYTSSAKLAVGGDSNGGLLVGAVMTQRPELFGAALPAALA